MLGQGSGPGVAHALHASEFLGSGGQAPCHVDQARVAEDDVGRHAARPGQGATDHPKLLEQVGGGRRVGSRVAVRPFTYGVVPVVPHVVQPQFPASDRVAEDTR